VQAVTPEELEVAIANREKAILVDFFGGRRAALRQRRAAGARWPRSRVRARPPGQRHACAPPARAGR
jgi:hypothetical protein